MKPSEIGVINLGKGIVIKSGRAEGNWVIHGNLTVPIVDGNH
jgi:hypothetical protein